MDKMKGIAKGGWHPSGDRQLHRDTWKSDLKGMATGKTPEKKHLEEARNHTSAPLSALKDPDSFGPPPKHNAAAGSGPSTPTSPARPRAPTGGLGGPVPAPRRRQEEQEAQEEQLAAPPVPYRTDTTGLKTDNLPKPPVRRAEVDAEHAPAPPPRITPAPASNVPVRSQQAQPPQPPPSRNRPNPTLPPRMNDHPDEFTPPPPPAYHEATQPAPQNPAILNAGALNRLGQAGVSVPGLGIGKDSSATPSQNAATIQSHAKQLSQNASTIQSHAGQLSELQQRFSRMGTGASNQQSSPVSPTSSAFSAAAAVAQKKAPPPPPPPKKPGLSGDSGSRPGTADGPPPLPLLSKPRSS